MWCPLSTGIETISTWTAIAVRISCSDIQRWYGSRRNNLCRQWRVIDIDRKASNSEVVLISW
jgi:hypothetical protein